MQELLTLFWLLCYDNNSASRCFLRLEVQIQWRYHAGSRLAGQLGRWPVEMSMRLAACDPAVRGWSMPRGPGLLYASYIDNLYGVADSPVQLALNVKILERLLMERWRLRIKPGSSQMVVCRCCADVSRDYDDEDDDGPYWNVCGWRTCQSMNVLGHQIAWDGSPHECLAGTTQSPWRRFWATTASRAMRRPPMWCRLRMLSSAVVPVLTYRMPRWPWAVTTATALGRLKRRRLAILLQVRPYTLEEVGGLRSQARPRRSGSPGRHWGVERRVCSEAAGLGLTCRPPTARSLGPATRDGAKS